MRAACRNVLFKLSVETFCIFFHVTMYTLFEKMAMLDAALIKTIYRCLSLKLRAFKSMYGVNTSIGIFYTKFMIMILSPCHQSKENF